jgi:uncharacterized protein (DUF1697 family)
LEALANCLWQLDWQTRRRVHKNEQIALGSNELYIHYGEGMADSKLKIPAAKTGTARNMNTVGRLAEMAFAIK